MLSSSHLKITWHLHIWKGHYCYGIIYKLCLLQQINIYTYIFMWNGVTYFIGVYITKNNGTLHGLLEIQKFEIFVWKNISLICFSTFQGRFCINFQAAMYYKVLHVYIMYIDLFIHLSWLFTLYLIVDRQDVLLHILLVPTATHTAYSQYWDMVW